MARENPPTRRSGSPGNRKRIEVRNESISLASYTVRIREKRDPDSLRLGSFDGTNSFMDFFREFMNELATNQADDDVGMSFQRARDLRNDGNTTCGIVEAGDYGYTAELVDVSTRRTAYSRTLSDAELLPFYFLLDAPAKSDKAIFIVQRFGNRGVYTEFTKTLREAFDRQYNDYLLDIRRHVPAEVLNILRAGQIKTIELTSYQLSGDIADRLRWKGNKAKVGKVVISIQAERNSFLPRLDWLDKMLRSETNLYEIPDSVGEIGTHVKVAVDYNGKTRYVNLEQLDSIAPYLDITSDIEVGPDGHPTFKSIDRSCRALLTDLIHEIGRAE